MELERELGQQSVQLESLTEDKVRLMREIAQLRAGNTKQAEENTAVASAAASGYYYTSPPVQQQQNSQVLSPNSGLVPKVSTNATISSVGALKLYEFMLAIFFVAAMMNWILF